MKYVFGFLAAIFGIVTVISGIGCRLLSFVLAPALVVCLANWIFGFGFLAEYGPQVWTLFWLTFGCFIAAIVSSVFTAVLGGLAMERL